MTQPLKYLTRFETGTAVALMAVVLCSSGPAQADSGSLSHGLNKALSSTTGAALYQDKNETGAFTLSGAYFAGLGSGNDASGAVFGDGLQGHSADLAGDQRVYALLIDGSYDFNHDTDQTKAWHPYVAGGVGMAMAGSAVGYNSAFSSQDGAAVPLFRVGGGVTYRLGEAWNLSLDYKAGFTGPGASDELFTGRGQHPLDMQTLNMGLRYQF